MSQPGARGNQEATLYIGNLDERVTEALLWELFVQVGRVIHVFIPKDRISQSRQGYGFVEFQSEADADYASCIMNMVKLYGKPMRINRASADKRSQDMGAILFVGNLDSQVDEKILHDVFGSFGVVLSVNISYESSEKESRDPTRKFGFLTMDTFESADAAIEAMNGQFIMNRPIQVSYALKKDGSGERHGTAAERLLASQASGKTPILPNRLFIHSPGSVPIGKIIDQSRFIDINCIAAV